MIDLRFLLFAGDRYYASGGFNDLKSSHETLEDAVLHGYRITEDVSEWWHVVEVSPKGCIIIAGSLVQAYGAPDLPPPKGR